MLFFKCMTSTYNLWLIDLRLCWLIGACVMGKWHWSQLRSKLWFNYVFTVVIRPKILHFKQNRTECAWYNARNLYSGSLNRNEFVRLSLSNLILSFNFPTSILRRSRGQWALCTHTVKHLSVLVSENVHVYLINSHNKEVPMNKQ